MHEREVCSRRSFAGVDFLEKSLVVNEAGGDTVKLMIWDTAGQEEFDALTAGYYRGAGACAIVFSTVDRTSFDAIDKWRRKVEDECGPLPIALVQNKVDLVDTAAMTSGEAEAAARRLGVRLYRTCVKDNTNVAEVFEYLAAQVSTGALRAAPPSPSPHVPSSYQFILKGGDTSGVSALPAAGDYSESAIATIAANAATAAASSPVANQAESESKSRDYERAERAEEGVAKYTAPASAPVAAAASKPAAPVPAPAPATVPFAPASAPDNGIIKLGAGGAAADAGRRERTRRKGMSSMC